MDKNSALASLIILNEETKQFFNSLHNIQPSHMQYRDAEGNTPLHYACMLGQLEVVRLLVKRGIPFLYIHIPKVLKLVKRT